jgi:hypothetical protein
MAKPKYKGTFFCRPIYTYHMLKSAPPSKSPPSNALYISYAIYTYHMLKSAPLHLFFLSEGDEVHPSDHPSKSPPSRAIFHDMDGVQFYVFRDKKKKSGAIFFK